MAQGKLREKLSSLIGDVECSASTEALLQVLGDPLDELLDRHAALKWNDTPLMVRIANLAVLEPEGEVKGLGLVTSIQTLSDGSSVRITTMTTAGKTFVYRPADVTTVRLESEVLTSELHDLCYRLLSTHGDHKDPLWVQLREFLKELEAGALSPAPHGRSDISGMLAPARCPKCRTVREMRFMELVEMERELFGFNTEGVLLVFPEAESWDGDGSRVYLWCRSCDGRFEVPDYELREPDHEYE